jgi:hypothetical protein
VVVASTAAVNKATAAAGDSREADDRREVSFTLASFLSEPVLEAPDCSP